MLHQHSTTTADGAAHPLSFTADVRPLTLQVSRTLGVGRYEEILAGFGAPTGARVAVEDLPRLRDALRAALDGAPPTGGYGFLEAPAKQQQQQPVEGEEIAGRPFTVEEFAELDFAPDRGDAVEELRDYLRDGRRALANLLEDLGEDGDAQVDEEALDIAAHRGAEDGTTEAYAALYARWVELQTQTQRAQERLAAKAAQADEGRQRRAALVAIWDNHDLPIEERQQAADELLAGSFWEGLDWEAGRRAVLDLHQRVAADPKLATMQRRVDAMPAGEGRVQALIEFERAVAAQRAEHPTPPALPVAIRFPTINAPALTRKKDGSIEPSHANAFAAVADPSFVNGMLIGRDTFRDELMLSTDGGINWRAFTDSDRTTLHRILDGRGFKRTATQTLRDVVNEIGDRRKFDSARVWLRHHVPAWDGVPRVESFACRYLGSEDSEYTRAVGRYWWTAMAGRVLSPGIKADMVPVLVGPQGAGKSTAVAALVPDPDFFVEIDIGERDENLSRMLRGRLVAEIAELRGLSSRDAESIKAWITRTHEVLVRKYEEFASTFPRRCVFVGTSNEPEFLSDPSGERRWLPVTVGECDAVAIEADRLQLWAEAREMYQRDGIAYADAERLARKEHGKFKRHDPWADRIEEWLADRDGRPFTTRDVLGGALGLNTAQQRSSEDRRVAAILREAGYVRDPNAVRVDGERGRYWRKRG